jgi:nucleoside 2-deoxyribosyltransferase
MLKIYCVRPISGRTFEEMFDYYDHIRELLRGYGYTVLTPSVGKEHLREKGAKQAPCDCGPELNHSIVRRDYWMVRMCDVIYANFLGATEKSIGSSFELAWAFQLNKHSIVVMEEDNLHRHGFILEAVDQIFSEESLALDYLRVLVTSFV